MYIPPIFSTPLDSFQPALSFLDSEKRRLLADRCPTEQISGLEMQRITLLEIANTFSFPPSDSDHNHKIFKRLRDSYSLYPANNSFLSIFRALLLWSSHESCSKLSQDVSDKLVVAHITCKKNLNQAMDSVISFNSSTREKHLIVYASDDQTSLAFSYDGSSVMISTGDSYESLADKVFLLYTILSLLTSVRGVLKIDDNVNLASRNMFNSWMNEALSLGYDYAGKIKGKPGIHRDFWHGWHVSKCRDERFEMMGHQMPVYIFAEGGFGYYLSKRSLRELAYAYLSHRAFFESSSILYEDVTVGLFLLLSGITGVNVTSSSMGLKT